MTSECRELREEIELENARIEESLRNLYNLAIEKSGQYVNMIECDNCSARIFKLMAEEIEELQPLFELDREAVSQRLKANLNCAATICQVNKLEEEEQQIRKLLNSQVTKSLFPKILTFLESEFLGYA